MRIESKFQRNTAKIVVYGLMTLLCYILQTVPKLLEIGGIKPLWLFPLAVCISIFEGVDFATGISIFCGLLWDMASGRTFGFSAIMLLVICVTVSLLIMYLIRATFTNAMLFILAALITYFIFDIIFFYAIWNYPGVLKVIKNHVIPICIYTMIISPLIFWSVKKVTYKFSEYVRI